MFCAAFRRFVVGGKRFSSAAPVLANFSSKYALLVQNQYISHKARLVLDASCNSSSDLSRSASFIVRTNMSPRGKAKAKSGTDENGKERRVRESRNVKAASYKDFSDSEEEKVTRRKKNESESESMSEEEKPKKKVTKVSKVTKVAKGRRVSARSKKVDSESEEASDISEESSDGESRSKRKSSRKPIRSLRAPQKTSYKDLSDSEEDSNQDQIEDMESASDEDEASPKPSGKQKKGRGRERPKVAKKEESSDSEDDAEKDGNAESKEADINDGIADSSETVKGKSVSAEKKDADSTVSKKERTEHEMSEEDESDVESPEEDDSKKRARPVTKKDKEEEDEEPQAKKAKVGDKPPMNKTDTDYSSIDFSSDAKTKSGDPWNFKISSWNIAGLKGLIKKNGLEFIKHENPDILCLQETKCSEKKLPPEANVDGYQAYWLSGEKDGYAGVAVLSKTKPIDVKYGLDSSDFDTEGRVITAEYDKFFLVNVYVPNAGQGLKTLPKRLEWDPVFRAHLKKLDEQKPVILCGDLNVAHCEIDLTNPKTNVKNAGFTPQEREGMTQLLKEGFVDTFRNLYPDKSGAYSFWTYMGNARSRNVGWRLDYFITSERFLPQVCDNIIRSEVYGSDHCPITLLMNL